MSATHTHTQPPWTALIEGREQQGGETHCIVAGEHGACVAMVPFSSSAETHGEPGETVISDSEAIANTRLMAAAPELLTALKTLHDKTAELIAHLQATDRLRPCFNLPALAEAQAAIKAAEDKP